MNSHHLFQNQIKFDLKFLAHIFILMYEKEWKKFNPLNIYFFVFLFFLLLYSIFFPFFLLLKRHTENKKISN